MQNNALLYEGLGLEDGVFVGPQVCFTNDFLPRAVNPDLSLKAAEDWHVGDDAGARGRIGRRADGRRDWRDDRSLGAGRRWQRW